MNLFSKTLTDALDWLPLDIVGDMITFAQLGQQVIQPFNQRNRAIEENRLALASLQERAAYNRIASQFNKTRDRINFNTATAMARRERGITAQAFAQVGINNTSGSALDAIEGAYHTMLTQALRQTI